MDDRGGDTGIAPASVAPASAVREGGVFALAARAWYSQFIFVMIDGATYKVLRDLVATGELPALARLAEERGGVKQAAAAPRLDGLLVVR
jgi:hypothetical protein